MKEKCEREKKKLCNNDAPVRVSAGREEQLLGIKPLLLSVWANHRNRQNMHILQRGKNNTLVCAA